MELVRFTFDPIFESVRGLGKCRDFSGRQLQLSQQLIVRLRIVQKSIRENMHHPYQCIEICTRLGDANNSPNCFLLAASGPKLYSVHLSTGAIVSSWPPEDEISSPVSVVVQFPGFYALWNYGKVRI